MGNAYYNGVYANPFENEEKYAFPEMTFSSFITNENDLEFFPTTTLESGLFDISLPTSQSIDMGGSQPKADQTRKESLLLRLSSMDEQVRTSNKPLAIDEDISSEVVSAESKSSYDDSSFSSRSVFIEDTSDSDYHGFRSRSNPWTPEECQKLKLAMKLFGARKEWGKISKFVGTRNALQCINKWKNDLGLEKKSRWSRASKDKLLSLINQGFSDKEIYSMMPEHTYIQIYQQLNKLKCKQGEWSNEEKKELIHLKKEGIYGDAEIGHMINNRHRDDVKNMWNRIRHNHDI